MDRLDINRSFASTMILKIKGPRWKY